MTEMTYARAGVNIEMETMAVKGMIKWLSKTFKFRENKIGKVMHEIGSFANLIDMGEFALAMSTDGVGSKVLVAEELKKYDTIGIDLVAMNVNDIICLGAEPIAMVDYLAIETINPDIIREIGIGIYGGAKIAGIAVIGGETAILPDMIKGIDKMGFDLAGTAIGIVKKNRIIDGSKISPKDIVLGFKSNGIHSNGLTLARKVLPKDMWMELLNPTRIYVKEILELLRNFDIHGLAHITGCGFRNLKRTTKFGFHLDSLPEPQMIFKKIQELGGVTDREMYRTFNMGIGFCVIVDENNAEKILQNYGEKYKIIKIGYVVEEPVVKIFKDDKEIIL